MTSHKRKASQELTSNSVTLLEPLSPTASMRSVLSQTLSWCRDLYKSWFPAQTAFSSMAYTYSEIVADNHIQSHQQREDGAISLKRQRMKHQKPARSRSTVDEHRKAGRGKLDYAGCLTESDYQKRNDDFWAPPEPGLLRGNSKSKAPSTPEAASNEEQVGHESLRRRHSESILSPRTPGPILPIQSPDPSPKTALKISPARVPRARESLGAKAELVEARNDVDISKRLEDLLITPEDDQKQSSVFGLSKYMKEKLAKQAREREAKEKEAALQAAKERRLGRRNPLKQLVQPLNNKWEEAVNEVQWEHSHHRVITTAIKGTELRRKDFQTLLGYHSWLNDEIINAYLEWIEDAANKAAIAEAKAAGEPVSQVPKFITQLSFFYETLSNKGPNQTERLMKRKKAPGKSFMEVDSMFVPICKGNHWTVGVVRPITKTIEYFDSMGGSSRPFIEHMRRWLKFQLGDLYVEEEWKVPRTACAVQNNGYDCGVFVCTNSLCVALGLDTSCYSERDMTQQRRNIAAVLVNRGFIGDFAWGKSGW